MACGKGLLLVHGDVEESRAQDDEMEFMGVLLVKIWKVRDYF